jgi:hypothetical protein
VAYACARMGLLIHRFKPPPQPRAAELAFAAARDG